MGELIEGLNDATRGEYARLREELRIALAESNYTLEQAATFADVSVGTVRNALNGSNAIGIDKLIRLLLILGGRIEIVRSEGAGVRPFQVVAIAPLSSSGKASSTLKTSSGSSRRKKPADITPKKAAARKSTKPDQRRGTSPDGQNKRRYNTQVAYLRNYTAGTHRKAS